MFWSLYLISVADSVRGLFYGLGACIIATYAIIFIVIGMIRMIEGDFDSGISDSCKKAYKNNIEKIICFSYWNNVFNNSNISAIY